MNRVLNFTHNFFSLKTLRGFVAYVVVGLLFVLLIPSQVFSHISPSSSANYKNYEVRINNVLAQANPGDGVIREVINVLNANNVTITDISIEGRCHGRYFHKLYNNPQASGDSELQVASRMLKESSFSSVVKDKQFGNFNVQLANNDWNAWLSSQVKGVLERNGFTGWIKVNGRHRPDNKPCKISLSIEGCDRSTRYCP
jgi:hypothetical protein